MSTREGSTRDRIEWSLSELGPRARPAAAPGESRVLIHAADGYPLAGTLYEPRRPNRITVQINAAYAVPRAYYAAYARYLALRGFTVLTYDYRGVGDSRAPDWSGEPPVMRHWGERDVAAAIEWLRLRYPAYRSVHVGHSAGGQMFGLAANKHSVASLLAVSSQSGHWKLFDFPYDWLAFAWFYAVVPLVAVLSRVFPGLRRGGFDVPPGVALQWARWGRGPYVADERGRPLRAPFLAYTGRVRLYHVTDDHEFAPRRTVEALAAFYANARVEVAHRAPADWGMDRIGHFGFFRPGMSRLAWEETARWLAGETVVARPAPAPEVAAIGEEEFA